MNSRSLRRNIISDHFVQPYTKNFDDGACDYDIARESDLKVGNHNYYNRPQNYENQMNLIKDHIPKDDINVPDKPSIKLLQNKPTSAIELKGNQINEFITKHHSTVLKNPDPTFAFAKILIENVSVANKKKTLEKARDLAANIHY